MTRENLEIAKKLVEKIDATERLLLWAAKGFTEPKTKSDGIGNNSLAMNATENSIRTDLILVLPEIEDHFKQMKRQYEEKFAFLK